MSVRNIFGYILGYDYDKTPSSGSHEDLTSISSLISLSAAKTGLQPDNLKASDASASKNCTFGKGRLPLG